MGVDGTGSGSCPVVGFSVVYQIINMNKVTGNSGKEQILRHFSD
jgi:hypothetical protein